MKHKKERLAEYCQVNSLPAVKPFVLISTKDTTHAGQINVLIESENFCEDDIPERLLKSSGTRGEENR
jgi:hypothetical protein